MADARQCEQCGREYTKAENVSRKMWALRRYCSVRCAGIANRTAAVLQCPICGSDFRQRNRAQRTCTSEDCRAEYRRTVSGPASGARMRADYASGKRKRTRPSSFREVTLWPFLAPHGWFWRARWTEDAGTFELDFAEVEHKLNVEIDGPEHKWARKKREWGTDDERDHQLRARGWRILRIPNEDVDADAGAVAERVLRWAALGDNQRDARR